MAYTPVKWEFVLNGLRHYIHRCEIDPAKACCRCGYFDWVFRKRGRQWVLHYGGNTTEVKAIRDHLNKHGVPWEEK